MQTFVTILLLSENVEVIQAEILVLLGNRVQCIKMIMLFLFLYQCTNAKSITLQLASSIVVV